MNLQLAEDIVEKYFGEETLKEYFYKELIARKAIGLDNISTNKFSEKLDKNIEIINKKIKDGTYTFSPYRLELLIKGIDKTRNVCVSTVRDNLVLFAIKEYLNDFIKANNREFFYGKSVQKIILEIKNAIESEQYSHFLKLDIHSFYDNIEHEKLIEILQAKQIDVSMLNLISKAIKNRKKLNNEIIDERNIGVPQGIPISTLLANIYLESFDMYNKEQNYKYFRYVDDIFIVCNSEEECKRIKHQLTRKLKMEYYLEINEDKTVIGSLDNEINYIGYSFKNNKISVRKKSILKIEKSIEDLFKRYVYQYKIKNRKELFLWYLNIRITGAKYNNKKYGWLFFFSQINDYKLLFHLDNLVKKFIKRFNLADDFKENEIKRFVRSFNEIQKNLDKTKYIPNIDTYTIEDKKDFLENVVKLKVIDDETYINRQFDKFIFDSLKDLEEDLQRIS